MRKINIPWKHRCSWTMMAIKDVGQSEGPMPRVEIEISKIKLESICQITQTHKCRVVLKCRCRFKTKGWKGKKSSLNEIGSHLSTCGSTIMGWVLCSWSLKVDLITPTNLKTSRKQVVELVKLCMLNLRLFELMKVNLFTWQLWLVFGNAWAVRSHGT